jgi:hypothetical protein
MDDGWTIFDTEKPAAYSADRAYSGSRSMRLGIPPGEQNIYSFSSIQQTVVIPEDVTSATLHFYRYPVSGDVIGDRFDILASVNGSDVWDIITIQRSNAQSWLEAGHDLAEYVGKSLTLRFRVVNDGYGGVTAAWLDEVTLEVCTPN